MKRSALNALTVHYARSLASTKIKVNGAAPGHVATDFNGFRGTRTPEQGAEVAIRLAQLSSDGPTGVVFEDAAKAETNEVVIIDQDYGDFPGGVSRHFVGLPDAERLNGREFRPVAAE